MNTYIEEVMERITDLQQQTHFCVNNYDYYHKNNEFDILRQKEKQLHVSSKYLNGFLNTLADLQNTIEQITNQCDEVDAILENCTTVKDKVDEETESNKENIQI